MVALKILAPKEKYKREIHQRFTNQLLNPVILDRNILQFKDEVSVRFHADSSCVPLSCGVSAWFMLLL